jgi:hypothetical protein
MLIKVHLIVECLQNNEEKKENNKDKDVNNMNFKKNKKGHAGVFNGILMHHQAKVRMNTRTTQRRML